MFKDTLKFSTRRLIQAKINGGAILLFVALLAMIIANSPLKEYYNHFFSQEVSFNIGSFNLFQQHGGGSMTLLAFINDALMAIFFFSVGLEIKRELLVGELSSPRKALLPVIAACGGMIVPVLLFMLIGEPGPAARGAAIPMATDIAFSLGVLSLLGKKVPLSLKIFLTAFAVVDDIGGIIVIAVFYSQQLITEFLIAAAGVILLLYIGGKSGIHNKLFYIFLGIVVWYLFVQSGIHPTIAGVIVAFTVPARPKLRIYKYVNNIRESLKRLPEGENSSNLILSNSELSILKSIESASDRVISPLQAMDDDLHSLINYVVMPLFAFANASISFEGLSLASLQGISITIFISLVLGKLIGIFSFTYLSVKTGWLSMPDRMHEGSLFGISMIGGIGFTVSLFIANLSYAGIPEIGATLLNQAKIGIIGGSLFAGLCGYLILRYVLEKKEKNNF
ncbi:MULTISPECIES: Na+/H+ antiporter NhaA [Sanguibacteroides]|uniref:Na(+)/H(+) antiporter NhaA n=1 Tax=Sanguibacteroides justesenii TaxID=1547597 RepID=A0A0C3REN0_9PORP|nr:MULTISPECIES: Na+/H+ antiporter NhaA [Sanguibacteroides]KIO43278.1 sodium:proton antiporter [Sanguibacteroides justesenii]KIO44991.1 sodium:proton antiporter [Sanguibacteroides justesenii]PXZ42848.1 Na+/H+ antiporter NhaA [Sanguibacteroides justesenii]